MTERFVIGITEHRILGYVFIPILIEKVKGKEFYTITNRISSSNIEKYYNILDSDKIKLINHIEEYSENQLLKIFSKKKISFKDFIAGSDKDFIQNRIRHYIEARLIKCIDILQGNDIPLYFKNQQNNIYDSELIDIVNESAESIFNFKRKEGRLSYFLTINHNNQEIKLTGKEGIILVNEPCRMILNNTLYIFDDIDSKKLKPFFNKESIEVPISAEKKFLQSFVINLIRKYQVNSEGFEIAVKNPLPVPSLSIEKDLSGRTYFTLLFKYEEGAEYFANIKSEMKVTYSDNKNEATFYCLKRNIPFENDIILFLLEKGMINVKGQYFLPIGKLPDKTENHLYFLISWLNTHSKEIENKGIILSQEKESSKYYLKNLDLKIKISEKNNDWFDIQAIVELAGFDIPFILFRNHIISNIREYVLPNNEIVILPEEWFTRFKDIFKFSIIDEETISLDKKYFSILNEGLKGLDKNYSKKLSKWIDATPEKINLPDGINATLRPYQEKGYEWMFNLYKYNFGGCLADDMGLGKTLQTLTLLKKVLKEENTKNYTPKENSSSRQQLTIFDLMEPSEIVKSKPSLIIVPTSLVHNWINEIHKFAPDLTISQYTGQNRKDIQYYMELSDLVITSYGIIRNDIEQMENFDFLYIILDESQTVKNPLSKTYKSLIRLKSNFKLVLTGTPVENSLIDLWAHMNFVNPGLLGNLNFFKSEFVYPIEKLNDTNQGKKLRTLLSPFILRRTKQEVAKDLPDLIEQTIFCDMSDDQYKYYEEEKSKARNFILNNIDSVGLEKSSIIILQTLTRLRQIASHPVLIDGDYISNSGKFDEVVRNLNNIIAENHKVLIFSSFVKHLNLVETYCKQVSIEYLVLTGETINREKIVTQFQEDENKKVFLISIKAGGFGLNLTSADYVIILEPWWNPAVEEQALSRAHRIGQKNNVIVYRFIAKDSIEEKIMNLQQKKSKLANLFVTTNYSLKEISKDEIMQLFD